jgi:hypothetical protein
MVLMTLPGAITSVVAQLPEEGLVASPAPTLCLPVSRPLLEFSQEKQALYDSWQPTQGSPPFYKEWSMPVGMEGHKQPIEVNRSRTWRG